MDRPAFAVNESYELDFYVVSRNDDKVYGIEANAGKNAGISIRKMLDHKQLDYAVYARNTGKAGQDENVYTIPTFLLNKFSFDKGTPIKREPLKKMKHFIHKKSGLFQIPFQQKGTKIWKCVNPLFISYISAGKFNSIMNISITFTVN